MHDKRPALIARCRGVADVIDAVNFARKRHLLVAVRGGGHNVAGSASCDGGIMIDLSLMKGIRVAPKAKTVRVQPGVTLGKVDRETQVFGLATPLGNISTTGVAGLTLGGGLGHLRRKYGLAIDNLQSVDVVTANGQILTASEDENTDLFWGIRGGGGNFGIVTSFEYRLHPVGPMVTLCAPWYPVDNAKEILSKWRDFMNDAPEELSGLGLIWTVPAAPGIPEEHHGKRSVLIAGVHCGPLEEGARSVQLRKWRANQRILLLVYLALPFRGYLCRLTTPRSSPSTFPHQVRDCPNIPDYGLPYQWFCNLPPRCRVL